MRISPIILAIILLSFSVQALEIQSVNYNAGDTIIASAEGLVLPESVQVLGTQGNNLHIGLVGYTALNKSYVYFDIPSYLKGNYTLAYSNERLAFNVGSGDALAVRPVIIYASKDIKNSRIDLANKGESAVDAKISSSNSIQLSRQSITIPAKSSRSIFLTLSNPKIGDSVKISYDTGREYGIPLIIAEEMPANESVSLVGEPVAEIKIGQPEGNALILLENITEIRHSVQKTKMINGSLHFASLKELQNVQFHLTPGIAEIITLNATSFANMIPGQQYEQYLWINRYRNFPEGIYEGVLSLDSETGNKASILIHITLTKPIAKQEDPSKPVTNPEINKPSFNATETNFTLINYTEQARLEKENQAKNFRLGMLLLGIFLLIAALLIYIFRPKSKQLKFGEYVSKVKKRD